MQQRSAAELFWIVNHGIKMNGMPAFGPTHTEADIWNVTAFVRRLGAMQPTDYQGLMEKSEWSADTHSVHDH